MADERFTSPRAGDAASDGGHADGGGRGGSRPPGGREGGGFRIRLSDNEMQAARALQEAFGLRSTVAVLGFSLRTLAQQLEQGQLEDLIAQQRAQGGGRPASPRDGARSGEGGRSGERRRERGPQEQGRDGRGRVDPFARPARPAAAPAESDSTDEEAVAGDSTADQLEPDQAVSAEPQAEPQADAAADAPLEASAEPAVPTTPSDA
jgi:hypothetical protein